MNIKIDILFARSDSIYKTFTGVEVWDASRDARKAPGGSPAVAHPPCRSWGGLRQFSNPAPGEKELGPWAVNYVRENGGILEHPRASSLWYACGMPRPGKFPDSWGGWTLQIDQWDWGHRAKKTTWLYIVGLSFRDLPPIPSRPGPATHVITTRIRKGQPGWRPPVTKAEREATPEALARWLVKAARRISVN